MLKEKKWLMTDLKTKEGVLTPSDLAKYGIPPKQQPSHDPNLGSGRGEKGGKVQQWIGRAEKAAGE
jgi:hypothetical protein